MAELPKPKLILVSAGVVVIQDEPLATIKLFAVLDKVEKLTKLASSC